MARGRGKQNQDEADKGLPLRERGNHSPGQSTGALAGGREDTKPQVTG